MTYSISMFSINRDMAKNTLYGILESNTEINSLDFSEIELHDMDLSGKSFTACRFTRAFFTGVKLDGCRFRMCFFDFARFNRCSLKGCDIQFSSFFIKKSAKNISA